MENFNKIKMEMGGWYWKRLKYEGFGSIMRICIIEILRNSFQATCKVLMEFGEATTSEVSQLGERRLR